MPAVTNVGLSGGAWLTSDGGAACVDGKPARAARFTAAGTATVLLTFESSTKIRIAAMLGLHGVTVGETLSCATDTGTVASTVQRFANGSLGCWWVLPDSIASDAVAFTVNGGGTIDIGELVVMPGLEVDAERDWVDELIDPTETYRSIGSQITSLSRQPYRQISANFAAEGVAVVRGGGLANGMDWAQLRAAMSNDQRVVVVPRWRTPAGAVDSQEMNSTALYGIGRMAPIPHLVGNRYASGATFQEVPA